MTARILLGALALALPFAAPVYANDAHHASGAAGATDTVQAEVRKVDKGAKKLTLKHGELKNLGMPPMTMNFVVKDPAMLDRVKQGDTVRATLGKEGTTYVVTAIDAAK